MLVIEREREREQHISQISPITCSQSALSLHERRFSELNLTNVSTSHHSSQTEAKELHPQHQHYDGNVWFLPVSMNIDWERGAT